MLLACPAFWPGSLGKDYPGFLYGFVLWLKKFHINLIMAGLMDLLAGPMEG
jgi:hypothetical protein